MFSSCFFNSVLVVQSMGSSHSDCTLHKHCIKIRKLKVTGAKIPKGFHNFAIVERMVRFVKGSGNVKVGNFNLTLSSDLFHKCPKTSVISLSGNSSTIFKLECHPLTRKLPEERMVWFYSFIFIFSFHL